MCKSFETQRLRGKFRLIKSFNVLKMMAGFIMQAGIALGELRSIGDLYDFNSVATLFLIGVVSITPTLMSKSKQE